MYEEIINQFDKMIKEQAWVCLKRLNSYSMYEFDDLYNEGTKAILKQISNYDKEKASESTFIYKVLTSCYSNLLKKENNCCKRVDEDSSEILDKTGNYADNLVFKTILIKDSINNLPEKTKKAVNLALNPTPNFVSRLKNKRKIKADEVFRFLGYNYGEKKQVLKRIRKILNNAD